MRAEPLLFHVDIRSLRSDQADQGGSGPLRRRLVGKWIGMGERDFDWRRWPKKHRDEAIYLGRRANCFGLIEGRLGTSPDECAAGVAADPGGRSIAMRLNQLRKPGLHPSDIVRERVHLGSGSNLLDRAERSSPEAA